MSGTRIRHTSARVGPRHDPYSRETWLIYRNGYEYEIISCGLQGVRMTVTSSTGIDLETAWAFDNHEINALFDKFAQMNHGISFDVFTKAYERSYVPDPMGCLGYYE